MSSILTNNAATAALQTLRSITNGMDTTQNRISTGMRVANASDNAAYWSIATTMRSDNMALSAVQDALGLGAAKIDTAYAGMESAIDVVKEIKAKLVTAQESSADKTKIQEEISQLQEQLQSIAESSSFNEENWIMADAGATKSVVSGFVRTDGAVEVKLTEIVIDDGSNGNVLFGATDGVIDTETGILGTAGTNAAGESILTMSLTEDMTSGDVAEYLNDVETALTAMTSAGAKLGSISNRIGLQEDFVSKLADSIDSGVGRLVDADMNEESTRLKALQTQQQLAIQSLSIANSDSQNILSLFR
jgi:flagellin